MTIENNVLNNLQFTYIFEKLVFKDLCKANA